jgi:ABC-type oligopeptide transport system substrate-binding subunit
MNGLHTQRLFARVALAALFALGGAIAAAPAAAQVFRFANQGDAVSMDPHSLNESLQLSITGNIYEPLVAREQMGSRAIDSLLKTFFDNSVERAVTALLTRKDADVSRDELDRLSRLIEKAKKEGR